MSNPIRLSAIDPNSKARTEFARELKLARQELHLIHREQQGLAEMASGKTEKSPYFNDRPFSSQTEIQGTPKETEWKKVASYEELRESAPIEHNLRKLNII